MKILFVDMNNRLCDMVSQLNMCDVICWDILEQEWVIVTASNPSFTMWWGLDRAIANKYQSICNRKKTKKWGNERIANIIFTITVDDNIQATPELVSDAIEFAVKNTQDSETVLLSWLGTWIWGLPEKTFVNILSDVLKTIWNHQSM